MEKKCNIDSPFTNPHRAGEPSLTEGPGVYDKHPNLGPAAANGGLPLKFVDTAIKSEMPTSASMNVVPATSTKS